MTSSEILKQSYARYDKKQDQQVQEIEVLKLLKYSIRFVVLFGFLVGCFFLTGYTEERFGHNKEQIPKKKKHYNSLNFTPGC